MDTKCVAYNFTYIPISKEPTLNTYIDEIEANSISLKGYLFLVK